MARITLNKKGQSLVEVTVALSLLAVVLTGVVTLAVNAVSLMAASRLRTEATALAQEGLEIAKSYKDNGCISLSNNSYVIVNNQLVTLASAPEKATITLDNASYTREITIADDAIVDPLNSASEYALATVTVSWDLKGKPEGDIKIEQIIKRK